MVPPPQPGTQIAKVSVSVSKEPLTDHRKQIKEAEKPVQSINA